MKKNKEMEVTMFRQENVEEWYEEMNRQFEEDSKIQDFSISEEWDADFKRAMFGDSKRTKMQQHRRKLVYVAAGVAAVAIAGVGMTQREVIGDSLEKIFSNQSEVGDSEVEHFGTKEESNMGKDDNDRLLVYENKTLTEVYEQIRNSLKRPFFQIADTLAEYEIKDAVFAEEFSVISLKVNTAEGLIFLSQREVLDNSSTGTKIDDDSIVAWNDKLQQNIVISETVQGNSYTFSVRMQHIVFSFYGNVSKELCCRIAEGLMYE